jgi:hypothetical protein
MSYFDAAPGYFDASSVHPSTLPPHTNFYGDTRHDSAIVKIYTQNAEFDLDDIEELA